MTASVREQNLEIAGVRVRRLNIVVSGHTLQQLLFFDIADAEAVHGRPFDDDLGAEIQAGMLAADRGATGETMHKVASETSWTFDGLCIRAAGIEHCSDIVSGGSGEGSTEPWSCVPGTRPISHLDLTIPDDLLDSVDVPSALGAMSEMTAGIDRYMRNWTDALRGAMGLPTPERPEHDQLPAETIVTTLRYVTKPSGERDPVDTEGWRTTKSGRRDRRYTKPIGPPLGSGERGTDGTIERIRP